MTPESIECKNCKTLFEGNYCNNCGQKADQTRFTMKKLGNEFIHSFLYILRKGFIFTIKQLFLHPGEMLQGYLKGQRVNYINPFNFLLLISLVGGFFYTRSGVVEFINANFQAAGDIISFTSGYFSYRFLMVIPTYAFSCLILFRSFRYNLAEHLIINTFVISQSIVLMMIWSIIAHILKPGASTFLILYFLAFITVIIYQTYVFFQLFDSGNKILRGIKSITAVIFGLMLSMLLSVLLVKLLNYLGLH
jgi:hypothetical protein